MNWLEELSINKKICIIYNSGLKISGTISKIQNDYICLMDGNIKSIVANLSEVVSVIQYEDEIEVKQNIIEPQLKQEVIIENKEVNNDLKLKTLKQLRLEKQKLDREIVQNKLTDHTLTQATKVSYGTPNFFTKQSPE